MDRTPDLPACYDPLDPDQPHRPSDLSDGVVVGDDTDTMPRVEPDRPAPQWGVWLAAGVTWLLVLASLAAIGWGMADGPRRRPQYVIVTTPTPAPVRSSLPDRCCDRTPSR